LCSPPSPLPDKDSYSRRTDRSVRLCFKTPRAGFLARGSSVRHPLSWASCEQLLFTRSTYDLGFDAFPIMGIAPLRLGVGSSAYKALLPPIICISPSSRQPIRGVTLGFRFLRNPSPHALRLAPAPPVLRRAESTYGVTSFLIPVWR
jgi:hypothetical protein